MKLILISLGCHKNLVDSENMLGIIENDDNYEITTEIEEAEVAIINSCSFILDAKEESIETILDVAQYKNKGKLKKLIVAGCLAQRYAKDLKEDIPEVDAFVGTGEINKILTVIDSASRENRIIKTDSMDFLLNNSTGRLLTTFPHVAYIKIAEGCNNNCSYCIIPKLRGKFRSRPIEDIVEEIEKFVKQGVREFNIIAQDSTNYGIDIYKDRKLPELMEKISKIKGADWIKLFYTYPDNFSDELINVIKNNDNICNYFDIPIQHISDNILKRMNRKSSSNQIKGLINNIKTQIPDAAIRSSLIVGFPGETEKEYEELVEFVKETEFDYLGIFKYSREEDTPAYDFENQISEEDKNRRWKKLVNLQNKISEKKNQKLIGKTIEVIIDDVSSEHEYLLDGRAKFQALDIDGKVIINDGTGERGEIVKVKIEQNFDYDLLGGIVENEFTK